MAHNGAGRLRAVADPAFVPEQYGFVVRQGDEARRARRDAGLAAIRANGRYDRIHERWFGTASTAR